MMDAREDASCRARKLPPDDVKKWARRTGVCVEREGGEHEALRMSRSKERPLLTVQTGVARLAVVEAD